MFVMWCGPDEDEDQSMQAAVDQGLVIPDENGWWPSGNALCCRWHGSGPMPEPRWVTIENEDDVTLDELTYMLDSVKARLLREGRRRST